MGYLVCGRAADAGCTRLGASVYVKGLGMRFAKYFLAVMLAIVVLAPVVGCGVGTSMADSRRTLTRIIDYDARMLVDDIAVFTQTTRTFRTSRWVID